MMKKLFLSFLALLSVAVSSASAAVLDPAQLTATTDAITAGIGEYVAFILAVIVITYPATLIIRALRNIGRGRSS